MITGNRDEAREFGRRTMEIAERCRFDYFQLLGTQYLLMPEPDRPCDVAELEQYGLGMDLVGHGAFRPTHLGIIAQNHHYLGDPDPALRALEEAMERTTTSGERVHQPDLLRLRAEITTAAYPDRTDEAARDLVAAVEIGLAQGSLLLRCARPTTWPGFPATARPTGATGSAPWSTSSRPIPPAPNWPRR